MLKTLLLVWLLCTSLAAQDTSLDGVTLGQKPPPDPRGFTRIEVKDGIVVSVWGRRLQTSEGQLVQWGDSDAAVLAHLGKAERTLYGCGKENQQVRFYDKRGLEITSTNDKVTQIHLFLK
ncbi:hypothetical protein IV102_36010 [bacterium]|nr:hypothetical protein [bacterium]